MLKDKNFQIGFIVVELLAILLFGLVAFPFAKFGVEFWAKMDDLGVWLMQIFFLILTIIFLVVGVKLFLVKDNKFRYVHLLLAILVFVAFLIEASFCIQIMGEVANLPKPDPVPNDSASSSK